jgi:hypothetical protein
MKYTIPLLIDSNNEPTGLFSLYTTQGRVVIIFTNPLKWEKFAEGASAMSASQGEKVGSTEMEASSMTDIIRQLITMDPTLAHGVNFLPDSDPLCDQLLASM